MRGLQQHMWHTHRQPGFSTRQNQGCAWNLAGSEVGDDQQQSDQSSQPASEISVSDWLRGAQVYIIISISKSVWCFLITHQAKYIIFDTQITLKC